MAMDPKDKKEWVEALRSGEYEQCCLYLHNVRWGRGYGFCCLGVAADIFVDGEWELDEYGDYHIVSDETTMSDKTYYPPGVDEDAARKLMQMNDMWSSFDEIADWIEANL